MLKRYELHNHTTHSDAGITCLDLVRLMEKDQVDAAALTDHNTISGHRELREILRDPDIHVRGIYGMEYTTYYGHILCLNLHRYVPWETIDARHPEKLFKACKEAGALTGVAHPFSYGAPFARGCRFEMEIHDFSHVDFIEIFNDPEPLHEVNEPALAWWESLCLGGEKLAATAGMDLHDARDMSMMFATYLEGEQGGDPEKELENAILSRQTWVSKGIIVKYAREDDRWLFTLEDAHKPGFRPGNRWLLSLRGAGGEKIFEITEAGIRLQDQDMPAGPALIVKLFMDHTDIGDLVCVAPVLSRS